MQALGLQGAYINDRGTHALIKQIMALPFLPKKKITTMFGKLEKRASTPQLREFTEYVKTTWIESEIWPPSTWTVYMQSVRTNNDVEGWHNGLNRRASGKSQLPLYLLIKLLHREACLTSLQIRLVSEQKLKRMQRKKYKDLQSRLFNLWEEFQHGNRTVGQLLKACAHLNGPTL